MIKSSDRRKFFTIVRFTLLCRTSAACDGNNLQRLWRGLVKEKGPLCPLSGFVSFCGAEAILLTGSCGCGEPQRRPWTPAHLEKERKHTCIRHPFPLPHPTQSPIFRDGLSTCSSSWTGSRFFSGVCESHKEAEAETFTTHLPPINPGLVLRTNSYWAPSIGICASICFLSSSKRALSSWAVITLKKLPAFSS